MTPHLRVARAAGDLESVTRFYRDGLDFDVIGHFENHAGFGGVMLGRPGLPWHLEFTKEQGVDAPRSPSTENLLVLYLPDRDEWQGAVDRMIRSGYAPVPSHNPYWDLNGKTFEDPDGYRVVLHHGAW